MKAMPFSIASTLLETARLEPFFFPDGEELVLKAEVWKAAAGGRLSVVIWRRELMRLTPFSTTERTRVADCLVEVVDEHMTQLCAECSGQTAAECLQAAITTIRAHFLAD